VELDGPARGRLAFRDDQSHDDDVRVWRRGRELSKPVQIALGILLAVAVLFVLSFVVNAVWVALQ